MTALRTNSSPKFDTLEQTKIASRHLSNGEFDEAEIILKRTLEVDFDVRAMVLLSRCKTGAESVAILMDVIRQIEDIYSPLSEKTLSELDSTHAKSLRDFDKWLKQEYNYVLSETLLYLGPLSKIRLLERALRMDLAETKAIYKLALLKSDSAKSNEERQEALDLLLDLQRSGHSNGRINQTVRQMKHTIKLKSQS